MGMVFQPEGGETKSKNLEKENAALRKIQRKYNELRAKAQNVVDAFHSDSGEYSKMMSVCQLDIHLKGEDK